MKVIFLNIYTTYKVLLVLYANRISEGATRVVDAQDFFYLCFWLPDWLLDWFYINDITLLLFLALSQTLLHLYFPTPFFITYVIHIFRDMTKGKNEEIQKSQAKRQAKEEIYKKMDFFKTITFLFISKSNKSKNVLINEFF